MFEGINTTRTINDYLRWKELRDKGFANMTESERAEWGADMPGAYNASDLNRVGKILNYLRDRLTAAGYLSGREFSAVTTWEKGIIPTAAELRYYLRAVEIIRGAIALPLTVPAAPNSSKTALNFTDANNIEIIMLDVDSFINKMIEAYNICGDIFSGEIGR